MEMADYFQKVQTCDARAIQIRSNYETIVAEVYNCLGEVVETPTVTEEKTYITHHHVDETRHELIVESWIW
mgnify:CR=1 FL=1